MKYLDIVEARRALRLEEGEGDYATLADVALDGFWVSPIQMTSDSPTGPVIVANNFLNIDSAVTRRAEILRYGGYLPDIDFNRVLDLALWLAGMHRRDVYITQVVHLLPRDRQDAAKKSLQRRSFGQVTQHELRGRRIVAVGKPASELCREWLDERPGDFELVACLNHPSFGGRTWQSRANEIAEALCRATGRQCQAKRAREEGEQSVWQAQCQPAIWPKRKPGG